MTLKHVKKQDPELYRALVDETRRQTENLELIASENYVSQAVLEAQGSLLTNKYAEGYPGKRYYGGCEFVDVAETLAIERAKKLFGADHANVQPHSGTQANIAMYLSVLKPGDTVMGLNLAHGGHLSHGHPLNFSGKFFNIVPINVSKDTETIDYDEAEQLVEKHKPKMIFAGASNYSRVFDWARFKKMADSVGAYFAADIAHYAGLIAAGVYPSPVPHADFTTTTTHKTLRGPRGGMILCKSAHAPAVDKINFPGTQGGPLMHVIAAKAVCFGEALKPEFKDYQKRVLANARRLAKALADRGLRIVSGGTDCHLFSVDLRPKNATGKEAEAALDKAGITVNKNAIPYDPQKPFIASGVRIGTPAVTTRGMGEREMDEVAELIDEALARKGDDAALKGVRQRVRALTARFPIYEEQAAELLASGGEAVIASILIVDDEQEIRALLRNFLESRNHRVLEASDGAQAFAIAEKERPHLIIMDVVMTGVYGSSATKALRGNRGTAQIPIIIISGTVDKAVLEKALGSEKVRFLKKPFEMDQLEKLIREALPEGGYTP